MGHYSYLRTHLRAAAQTTAGGVVAAGAQTYERARCLPRILPVSPDEYEGPEPDTTQRLVGRLAEALRRERRLGRAGHWSYDLNRHIALAQAWTAESARLGRRP